jgi:sugar (pentulose or hexulose) kinase
MYIWHADKESFPLSGSFGPVRIGYDQPDFAADYVGVIESSLASMYINSRYFMAPGDTIYVAGGSTSSPEIMRRVAAIWNRNVVPIEKGGAALGAAVSGAYALLYSDGRNPEPAAFGASFLSKKQAVKPRPADVVAYHDDGGFLKKIEKIEMELVAAHPN